MDLKSSFSAFSTAIGAISGVIAVLAWLKQNLNSPITLAANRTAAAWRGELPMIDEQLAAFLAAPYARTALVERSRQAHPDLHALTRGLLRCERPLPGEERRPGGP